MKRVLLISTMITFSLVWLFSCQNKTMAQGISSNDVQAAWDNMTTMVVETARLMPAEHYGFVPVEPLSDFAGLINHTTGANYLFAATVNLERPDPMPRTDATKKDDVVADLEASFAFIKGGISQLSDQQLAEEIDWFGSKMSRLQAILTMTDHLQRQHGKAITYLRLKGVAPARSAGW